MGWIADGQKLVRAARRNPITLACILAGMVGVGVWLFFLENQIGHVEKRQTTIDHFIERSSACTEHPKGQECLEGITNAAERCLEDLKCATTLASAPQIAGELRQKARERTRALHHGSRGSPSSGRSPPATSNSPPAAEPATPEAEHHHSHPAPAGGGGSSHHHSEGGGHSGGSGQHPAPTVPEPTTPAASPAPAPEPTPGNSPEKEPPAGQSAVNVCVENPLLPACVQVNLGVKATE